MSWAHWFLFGCCVSYVALILFNYRISRQIQQRFQAEQQLLDEIEAALARDMATAMAIQAYIQHGDEQLLRDVLQQVRH